jgi:hypothetical protein
MANFLSCRRGRGFGVRRGSKPDFGPTDPGASGGAAGLPPQSWSIKAVDTLGSLKTRDAERRPKYVRPGKKLASGRRKSPGGERVSRRFSPVRADTREAGQLRYLYQADRFQPSASADHRSCRGWKPGLVAGWAQHSVSSLPGRGSERTAADPRAGWGM